VERVEHPPRKRQAQNQDCDLGNSHARSVISTSAGVRARAR
jgi:hypothetical protein